MAKTIRFSAWAAALLLSSAIPQETRAQCPEGSTEVDRRMIGDDLHVWCVPNGALLGEYRHNEARLAELATRIRQVDRDRAALEETLKRVRGKLERAGVDFHEIEADCEAWIDLAREARERRNEAGMNALATVLLARVDAIGKEKELATKADLDALYDEYSKSGLMTLAARNAREAGLVAPLRRWRDTQEFLSDLRKLTAVVSAAGAVSRGDDWRAIAKLTALLLKDPKARILVAETDYAIVAVYANAATWTAEQRIEQLLDMSEKSLLGLQAFTKVYRDCVNELRHLREVKSSLQEERDRIQERQRALRGDP